MNRFAKITSEKFRNATSRYTIQMVRGAKEQGEIRETVDTEKAAYFIDTYITVFSYSMVSSYQKNRFDSFFSSVAGETTTDEMIALMVTTIKQTLR